MDGAFRREQDVLRVHMPLAGGAAQWLVRPLTDAIGMEAHTPVRTVRIEAPAQWHWDSADAAFLARLVRHLEEQGGAAVSVANVPDDLAKLLALARQQPAAARDTSARPPRFATRVGLIAQARYASCKAFVELIGAVTLLVPAFIARRTKVHAAEVFSVVAESSTRALLIVGVVNLLMGAILAFVGAVQLRAFGVGIYVADLVGIAAVRELSPILTAIVLAGRTGASFAAHIATMQNNEEVDALTTLGVPPVEFLVLPRVVALSLSMPLLYVYACALSLLGGMLVAMPLLDVSATAYVVQTRTAIAGANFAIGALKALTFGASVALIGCHYGLRAARSAAGVGQATTMTVVSSIVVVIVLDAVFAICAHALDI
jgi:phospholipid/cholesterol/gamma-HCH transport system permease protein